MMIGHLIPHRKFFAVVCLKCCPHSSYSRVYKDNVYPYRQTCIRCKATLVESAGPGWCELYNGER